MTTVWICQLESKHSWFGWTTAHATRESARQLLRREQINDLVVEKYSRDEMKALDDETLYELWETETDRMAYCEEKEILGS
ncbi:hypothetical protein FF100_13735 [Methylobacterium terricola]|uniref:Uncharacterized protein n=1 Tax=Methylobacterium terricola TaxID=2583531 RepID=A0A5C4LHV1_9HYPH|nr:hypothetical protein [Methylobacterium terricola]TNC12725.1 hypothetical protein FF100_13735 [Methylobacterium terricola]